MMGDIVSPAAINSYVNLARQSRAADRMRSAVKGHQGKGDAARQRRLREACAGFEAIFINQLLKGMRRSIPPDPIFGRSLQRDIYTSMFDMEVANQVAHGKGMGIGDLLYRQLSRRVR